MTFLFEFNKFYLVPFLTEWLALQDYGVLETSCNRNQREDLQQLNSIYPKLFYKFFDSCHELPVSANLVGWILRHQYSFGRNTLMMTKEEKDYSEIFLKYDRQKIKTLLASLKSVHFKFPSRETHLKAYPMMLIGFCINAESVSLSYLRNRSSFLLETIARDLAGLTELSITHSLRLCSSCVIPIIRNCKLLKVLDLRDSEINCDRPFFNAIIVHGASLQKLHFGTKAPLRRDVDRFMLNGRCKLTYFDMTSVHHKSFLHFKGQHLKNLRTFCYQMGPITSLGGMEMTCPKLNCMHLEFLESGSLPIVLSVCCPALLLRFTCCCSNFDDEAAALLVASCPHLQALDLRGGCMTKDSLMQITKLTDLVALTLRRIASLNGDILKELMQKAKKIRALDISNNKQILDSDLLIALNECRQLTILNLMGCSETSVIHHQISTLCPRLEELYVITVFRDMVRLYSSDYCCETMQRFLVSESVRSCVFRPMGVDMMDRCTV